MAHGSTAGEHAPRSAFYDRGRFGRLFPLDHEMTFDTELDAVAGAVRRVTAEAATAVAAGTAVMVASGT